MTIPPPPPLPADIADRAVERVRGWLRTGAADADAAEREAAQRLHEVIDDPAGVGFTMRFVDRVIRPDDHAVAAEELHDLVLDEALPRFLGPVDRLLLLAGARLAPHLPSVVMPLARRRMRQIVGHLVVDARRRSLRSHLGRRRGEGFSLNVNLLGEAVLGEAEADARLRATVDLLTEADVDYVSVKISGVASQLNPWAFEDSQRRIADRLRTVFRAAAASGTFVNLDMEEYHDLELTIAAFTQVLDEAEFRSLSAGIVLQTYLPDSFPALAGLVTWANARVADGGADIKVRLVKGANLAMERVEAAIAGWEQAPYATKAEVDANYKRCIDWALRPETTAGVRFGIASHNLFDVAFAAVVAAERGVDDRVEMEMLEGMAPTHARTVRDATDGLLLYTPVVAPADFDVAISYLFRRLEENAAPGNFVRDLATLSPNGRAFATHETEFRDALAARWDAATGSRRTVNRLVPTPAPDGFANDPLTDPSQPANRAWVRAVVATPADPPHTAVTNTVADIEAVLDRARAAADDWAETPPAERRRLLRTVAVELDRHRGNLASAMVHEAHKAFGQIDAEICEAIDFARYYAERATELLDDHATFRPLGVVAVVPPWNFPVAIPTGGMLAALAAGNTVIAKPAPETPRCAEIVAECIHAAGIADDVLQFVRTPENEVGQRLITGVDGVILTGATETAALFRSWKPDLRLFAETSGKNALVVTPHADLDLAVADLVDSAFGHAGQKCSAASLAICVGDVYESERFRRQLRDAVESLAVGPPDELPTRVNPLIAPPNDRLRRALLSLDAGESWLVEPRRLDEDGRQWRPGVRLGVARGSWFHHTECFGPVLGVMSAPDLETAVAIQNEVAFGLTGGIHTLDPDEIATWIDAVEVGNAYVNRGITGAVVQRQPFGGWKRSSVGPGAKAGGPNYVRQLGDWIPEPRGAESTGGQESWLAAARASDEYWWATHFAVEVDPTELFCEANIFRYRPVPAVLLRVADGVDPVAVDRVRHAASTAGVTLIESHAGDESDDTFASRLLTTTTERVRVLGPVPDVIRRAANESWRTLIDAPVTASGRIELAHYLREQAVSETTHRFGNLVAAARSPRAAR